MFICAAVLADDSAVRGVGGSIAPMEQHPTVRMVSEKVDVKLGWDGAAVRCRFVFRNEGPAAIVKMGFPEESWGDTASRDKSTYRNFTSWVDGKKVQTKFLPSAENPANYFKSWHVKDVQFKAGQTRIIEDEYFGKFGSTSDGTLWFKYILASGKNWKGSIGKAVITIDATDVWSYWRQEPGKEYPNFISKGKKIIWILKNLEPVDDISYYLKPKVILHLSQHNMGFTILTYDQNIYRKHKIMMVKAIFLKPVVNIIDSGKKDSQKVTISYGKHYITLRSGSRIAVFDGNKKLNLPYKPYLEDHYLHVPILKVAKSLGLVVVDDKENGVINIKEPVKITN